jgi:hypothetical protein
MISIFKSKKKREQDLFENRLSKLLYLVTKYNLKFAQEGNLDKQKNQLLISIVKFIIETSLIKAGYKADDLNEGKAMMVMIIIFTIIDATCYYIPLINKNSNISTEFISSIISTSMFMPKFQSQAGSMYAEAMDICNKAQETQQKWITVLHVIGRSTMSFFESGANEEELVPIIEGIQLLLENCELK